MHSIGGQNYDSPCARHWLLTCIISFNNNHKIMPNIQIVLTVFQVLF